MESMDVCLAMLWEELCDTRILGLSEKVDGCWGCYQGDFCRHVAMQWVVN